MRCLTFANWLGWIVFIIIVSILVNIGLGFLPSAIGVPAQAMFQLGAWLIGVTLFFNMIATVTGISDERCDREGYYSFWPIWRPRSYMVNKATGESKPI